MRRPGASTRRGGARDNPASFDGGTKLAQKRKRAGREAPAGETVVGDWRRGRGPIRACVVYPNAYAVGMANLGFLAVYRILAADPRLTTVRAFLLDRAGEGKGIAAVEDGRAPDGSDLIAFSVSYESDFPNVARFLEAAGIPLRAADRADRHPVVVAGGVGMAINPEPLADLLDAVLLGEAEGMLPAFVERFVDWRRRSRRRAEFIESLADLPHAYVPSAYSIRLDDGGRISERIAALGFPETVSLARAPDGTPPCVSPIVTPESAFPGMALVETGRGCGRMCRFCAAGFLALPPREQVRTAIRRAVDALPPELPVGLLGTAVSDHGDLSALLADAGASGRRVSLSSIRLGNLAADDYRRLADSGTRQVALAPETGSERLRRVLNKDLADADLLAECDVLAAAGIARVKLYFMIGLPTETEVDLAAIPELARAVLDRLRAGLAGRARPQVDLSVNPLIPKPHTPFQWHRVADAAYLEDAQRTIRDGIAKTAGLRASFESPRLARRQALFALGDRRLGEALVRMAARGETLSAALRACGMRDADVIDRERGEAEVFPWDFVDTGVRKAYLYREYRRGLSGKLTERCNPGECRRCGACPPGGTGPEAAGDPPQL